MNCFYAFSVSDEFRVFSKKEARKAFEAISTKTVRFREPLTELPLCYFPSSPFRTRPR